MHQFEFKEFYKNVQLDISKARQIISDIEHFELYASYAYQEDENHSYYDENDFNKERLSDILIQIKLKIEFALEILELDHMLHTLTSSITEHKDLNTLEYINFVGVFYSPILWILENYLNAITSHIKIDDGLEMEYSNDKILLEQILKGTPKILKDHLIEPSNEAEVRGEVYKILIHVFPSTVREIPIAKVSKTYKPDSWYKET